MNRFERHSASWRTGLPVMVMEAQTLGSIAVIRSLGRAGYPVHACSSHPKAVGFFSRYANQCVVNPRYEEDGFVPWLRHYLRKNGIRAIIPSEGLLLALRPCFAEFDHLLPVSKDPHIVYMGLSKFDLFKRLLANGQESHLPPTLLVENLTNPPDMNELRHLGLPLFIKADSSYGIGQQQNRVIQCFSVSDAQKQLDDLVLGFRKVVVQGHVPGQGVGAFFLLWEGRLIAQFMHRRIHEVPYTGGVSSLRESWWHKGIRDDALAKLQATRWQGVAMMEYRWEESSDRFFLLEMNGRFWGSLHLALYSGVDFPLLLLDEFHARTSPPVLTFPLLVRCRHTFPKEVEYVWSRIKARELSVRSKLWAVLEFVLLTLDQRIHSDLFFPSDRWIFWLNLKRFLADTSRGLSRKNRGKLVQSEAHKPLIKPDEGEGESWG
jgi:predicted ATP-grasp superfamily ATP-dependent carboligase